MAVNADSIPRYEQPMDPPKGKQCGDCDHYEDVLCARSGMCGLAGICCLERDKGRSKELTNVDPFDPACTEWELAGALRA